MAIPHRQSLVAELQELGRRPVPLDRQVHRRGSEVLPDGDDIGALRPDVPHGQEDLVAALTEADHDPALADEIRRSPFGPAEHFKRTRVARLRAHAGVQTLDGLDVVVQDLRALSENDIERGGVSLEIGD